MLASQLINNSFPALSINDKPAFALGLMEDYDVLHLPVLSEEKFVGLVSKENLLDAEDASIHLSDPTVLQPLSARADEHFFAALRTIATHELSLLPIINDQFELQGVILTSEMLKRLSVFLGNEEKGAVIVLETDKRNFSFGEVSRLVETNDAYITQLNTYTEPDTGLLIVTIKINKMEVSDVVATFQRYEYVVRYYFGEEEYANELKENYRHLLSYLNM
jgi:acetoin utilization protein AcuB